MDPLPMPDHVVMLPPPLSTHPDLVGPAGPATGHGHEDEQAI